MNAHVQDPGAIIGTIARAALLDSDDEFMARLDDIPLAVYRTDSQGRVTHYNNACIQFAGRQPVVQTDRWCVTWKLYTTQGTFLPHDECPMAVAIRENKSVRGVRAVAERPDGKRVHFAPYPTPVRDKTGRLIGAVNMLVDIADPGHQAHCRASAEKCRRLARTTDDAKSRDALLAMAEEYEQLAGPAS